MELPASRAVASAPPPALSPEREKALRHKAEELEASFLSEMLSYTGLNETSDFAGGSGEDQFSSFLRDEQAKAMVRSGGIGLAETIFQALAKRDDTSS
jgi:flagellar protein FlgJ